MILSAELKATSTKLYEIASLSGPPRTSEVLDDLRGRCLLVGAHAAGEDGVLSEHHLDALYRGPLHSRGGSHELLPHAGDGSL